MYYLDYIVPDYEAHFATQEWSYLQSTLTNADYDERIDYLSEIIADEPAELEMPFWIARLHDLVSVTYRSTEREVAPRFTN